MTQVPCVKAGLMGIVLICLVLSGGCAPCAATDPSGAGTVSPRDREAALLIESVTSGVVDRDGVLELVEYHFDHEALIAKMRGDDWEKEVLAPPFEFFNDVSSIAFIELLVTEGRTGRGRKWLRKAFFAAWAESCPQTMIMLAGYTDKNVEEVNESIQQLLTWLSQFSENAAWECEGQSGFVMRDACLVSLYRKLRIASVFSVRPVLEADTRRELLDLVVPREGCAAKQLHVERMWRLIASHVLVEGL